MTKKNLLVLFGGKSSEYEVSCVSAFSVIENVSREKYNIITVGITKSGDWFLYEGDLKCIKDGSWALDERNKKVLISPSFSAKQMVVIDEDGLNFIDIDVVFPVLHGKNGEDGTVQGLFEVSGIPFVGCNTCSSAACMDKVITCTMLSSSGVKKPKFYWFTYGDYLKDFEYVLGQVELSLGSYPLFVKPANSGSSVGISKAHNRQELIEAIDIAKNHDNKILVEEYIDGVEIECAVLGSSSPIPSTVGEIVPSNEFYDYDAKYIDNKSELYVPARISEDVSDKVKRQALKAYKVMGCEGMARVDFLIRRSDNEVFLNEINTIPGFTAISMYPKLMEDTGITFAELIDRLIDLAIDRYVTASAISSSEQEKAVEYSH